MKPYTLLIGLIVLASCKKEDPPTCTDGIKNQNEAYADCGGECDACPVTYPEYGPIGPNLLAGNEDTLTLVASNYSFKAEIAPGSSLLITSHNLSGDPFLYGLNDGWAISNASNGLNFSATNPGTPELVINLTNSTGTALLEFKENGGAVSKQKVVVWQ